MNAEDVAAFYDDFLESRMLRYRLRGNKRIAQAAARILPLLAEHSRVLDLGCGIGIVAEQMAAVATAGHVWATDLSERNVWYAQQTVDASNATFFAADALEGFDAVRARLDCPVDLVTMVDVIEHLPKDAHRALFQNLRAASSEAARVVLTYPSPAYQRHLHANAPEHLQIIDQVIELEEVLAAARPAGYALEHFSHETIQFENQYVHCILRAGGVSLAPPAPPSLPRKVARKIRNVFRNRVLVPLRRRKYVERVFEEAP